MNTPNKEKFLSQMRRLSVKRSDLLYIRVYPSFVGFFRGREKLTASDFVIAANFTYGWMPTILKLCGTDVDWKKAAELLTSAKSTRMKSGEIKFLKGLVNRSLVGVSKILHFVNPNEHAIWDSRVYRYLTGEEPYYHRVSDVEKFLRYLEICDEIAGWPDLPVEIERLSRKIGQDLKPFRAIELTMYVNGSKTVKPS